MKKIWNIVKQFIIGFLASCFGWAFIDGLIKGITNLCTVNSAATAWSGVGVFLLGIFRIAIFIVGCFVAGNFLKTFGVFDKKN